MALQFSLLQDPLQLEQRELQNQTALQNLAVQQQQSQIAQANSQGFQQQVAQGQQRLDLQQQQQTQQAQQAQQQQAANVAAGILAIPEPLRQDALDAARQRGLGSVLPENATDVGALQSLQSSAVTPIDQAKLQQGAQQFALKQRNQTLQENELAFKQLVQSEKVSTTQFKSSVGKAIADARKLAQLGDTEGAQAIFDSIKKTGQTINIINDDGKQALSKTALNKQQDSLIQLEDRLRSLSEVPLTFIDDLLTLQGRAESLVATGLDFIGQSTDNQKERIRRGTQLRNVVGQLFNQYRKNITGAAASEQEIKLLEKVFLNTNLSPTQFRAAYQTLVNSTLASVAARRELLNNGITVQSVGREAYQDLLETELQINNAFLPEDISNLANVQQQEPQAQATPQQADSPQQQTASDPFADLFTEGN